MMDTLLIDAPTKDIVDTAVEEGSYKNLDNNKKTFLLDVEI